MATSNDQPEMPSATPLIIGDVPCVALRLPDERGVYHTAILEAQDWQRAHALTPEWQIADRFGKLHVVSLASAVILHDQRSLRDMKLQLSKFVMRPRHGHTVRFLDGDTLNLVRSNLVTRPKHVRTVPTVRPDKPLTAKERRMEAIVEAVFGAVH